MYTALSRVKTYDNFNCIGEFKTSMIKVNKDALLAYEPLRKIYIFSTIKRYAISGDILTVLVHNVRSLPQYVDEVVSDNRIINSDIDLQKHKSNLQILHVK